MDALLAAFRDARESGVRAVVLRGEGGQFSAGGDMSMLGAIPPPADPDPLFPVYRKMGHVLELLNALPQAVIAVVEGACTGGGLGMACCADVVIVREDAKIGLPEARSGFIPAQVIPHIVRRMGEGWTTAAGRDGRDTGRPRRAPRRPRPHPRIRSRGGRQGAEGSAGPGPPLRAERRRASEAAGRLGRRPPRGRDARRRGPHHSRPAARPRRPRRHRRLPRKAPASLGGGRRRRVTMGAHCAKDRPDP